jgi:hypothetical protein
MDIVSWVEKFGLGIALSIGVFTAFFYLLKWVLRQQETILKQAAEERKVWQTLFERNNKSIDEHIIQSRNAHDATTEAHRFQREEHSKLADQLNEITAALGRINGYKS